MYNLQPFQLDQAGTWHQKMPAVEAEPCELDDCHSTIPRGIMLMLMYTLWTGSYHKLASKVLRQLTQRLQPSQLSSAN